MEYLKEENKNLINLRTSVIAVVVVLTGGIVGLILLDANIFVRLFFSVAGLYLDLIFIHNIISINKKIENNLEEIKHGLK